MITLFNFLKITEASLQNRARSKFKKFKNVIYYIQGGFAAQALRGVELTLLAFCIFLSMVFVVARSCMDYLGTKIYIHTKIRL